VDPNLPGFKHDLPASLEPGSDQILHDLLLAINCDSAAAREPMHVDAMAATVEAQLDPVMNQTFAAHASANSGFVEQIHRALLENACPDPLLDMFAGLRLDDDGADALEVEQMGENEARRSGSKDADLGAKCRGRRHELDLYDLINGELDAPWLCDYRT
jgi:hypothetical protein